MNTTAVAATLTDTIGRLIQPAVAAVERLAGTGLTASAPSVVETIDPAAAATSVGNRVPLSGPVSGGSIVVAVPGAGHKLDPAQVAAAMVGGAAQELTVISGAPVTAGTPEAVADLASAATGATVVRFEVATGAGRLPIHWILDASIVAALTGAGQPSSTPPDVRAAAPAPSPTSAAAPAPAAFPELTGTAALGATRDLALLSDVPMDVTVELGKTVLQVRDLLSLREGSVVELDRSAGAAVDVLVNGTLVARGDVVVIDDDLGVRVTEIVQR